MRFHPAATELSQRYEVPGFSLRWDVWGDAPGPPLVLLHGYTGSVHDFALHIEALASTRRVFAIEHRGHGRSSGSGDPSTYTIDHLVDDTVAWVRDVVAADGQPIDLLGHSMGGRIAMRFALTRRDLLRSLILMDTTAWAFGEEHAEWRQVAVAFLRSIEPGQVPPRTPRSAEDDLIEAAVPQGWIDEKWMIRDQMDPMAQRALGIQLFENHLDRVDHQLGDIPCPTTVIAGEFDEPYVSHGRRLAEAIPGGRFVRIDGAYHSPQLTHGVEWLAAVEAHLARR
jgi:pimeloyl-ACP methyl ester carboxylesterase